MDDPVILYEDNHLVVVNKKNSDLVQGDKTGDLSLDFRVKAYLKEKYKKPGDVFLGVVHRLDRPVSGVVVFARTSKALSRMNELFRSKEIEKKYWAVVESLPPEDHGLLTHYLVRNAGQNKSYAYKLEKHGAKKAMLEYRLAGSSEKYFFLEIKLLTGRHHQIRAQLSDIGCPIVGDLKYGAKRSVPGGGIFLHSREIRFIHPVQKVPLTIVAPPPETPLWKAFPGTADQ